MAKDITVDTVTADEYAEWDTFVASSLNGCAYNTAKYLGILSDASGTPFEILAVRSGAQIIGGVAHLVSHHRSRRTVSNRSLLYFNGPIVSSSLSRYRSEQTSLECGVLSALLNAVKERYASITWNIRQPLIDTRVIAHESWTVKPSFTYVINLHDLKGAYEAIDKNLRRLIRRAEDAGTVLSSDSDFDSFYDLHLEIHHRKDAPLYLPREAFKTFVTRLIEQKSVLLFHARTSAGRALASQLVLLSSRGEAFTLCAGASADSLPLGANPFLRWKSAEQLRTLGFTSLDLTDAALNSVSRFKSELGAQLVQNSAAISPPSIVQSAFKMLTRFRQRVIP